MFLYRLHISLFHSFYRTQHICLHPGECKHPPHETLIKERDHTAHAKDSYNGSYADSDQMMRENHADRDGDADIQQIEAILRKADRAVNTVRDRLHDSVSGIRDNSHIQRHGSADSREDDTASQRKELQRQRVRGRNPCRKQIHKTGKDQAERQLQDIQSQYHRQRARSAISRICIRLPVTHGMEQQLYQDKHNIQTEGRIAEVQSANGRNTEGHGYNRRHAKSRLRIQNNAERQSKKTHDIEDHPVHCLILMFFLCVLIHTFPLIVLTYLCPRRLQIGSSLLRDSLILFYHITGKRYTSRTFL